MCIYYILLLLFSLKMLPALKCTLSCDHHALKDEQRQHHKASPFPQPIYKSILGMSVCLQPLLPTLLTFLHQPHQLCIHRERGQKLGTGKLFLFDFPLFLLPQYNYNRCRITTCCRANRSFLQGKALDLTQSRHPDMDAI